MTQKELLYLEDAIGHELSIVDILNETVTNIEDENLKTFIEEEIKTHSKTKETLRKLMEDLANE